MTDYGRLSARLQFGTNSDLSFPDLDSHLQAYNCSPTKYQHMQVGTSTSEKIIPLTQFTTVTGIFIVNKSITAAEIIDIKYATKYGILSAAAAPNTITLAAAATGDTITDDGAHGTLKSTYHADIASHVKILGSLTAANNDIWELYHTAAIPTTNVLTLAADSGRSTKLTGDAANASITLEFINENKNQLPAGGMMLVSDTLSLTYGVKFISRSGTPEVDLYILGT
jgi:hypothetical protein